jgi:hypothetical protein
MINLAHRLIVPLILSVAVFGVLWILNERAAKELGDPAIVTGWFLFGTILFLGAYNVRKKLAAFNVGPARVWLAMHIAGGLLAVALFLFHTGTLWPTGVYEQILATLFWIVTFTGFFGMAVIVTWRRSSPAPRNLGNPHSPITTWTPWTGTSAGRVSTSTISSAELAPRPGFAHMAMLSAAI